MNAEALGRDPSAPWSNKSHDHRRTVAVGKHPGREHSERLEQLIRAEIAAMGESIGFARYMELALYAPGLGYYCNGLPKFGPSGDFVTAPELSPLYGRCLAVQCQEVLKGLGGGDILELGAGSGRLAADLLLELERLGELPGRYLILDPSAELRERQRFHLQSAAPQLLSRIDWLDTFPESGLTGVVLANEVLDAMPVQRFRATLDGGIRELRVSYREGKFCWTDTGLSDPGLISAVARLETLLGSRFPVLYASEINPMIEPWIARLAGSLERGVALLADYGYPRREYYHPQRQEGTLMCHYRQRAHPDPLILTGLQDITAFVDFTAVAEAAEACGLELRGYTTQAHFLIGCGLEQRLAAIASQAPERYAEYARQAKTLVLPGEMGERFKVMALAKNWAGSLCGFAALDQRWRL